MAGDSVVIVAKNEAERNFEDRAAYFVCNIDAFVSLGGQSPLSEEFRIDGRDHFYRRLE